MSKKLVLPVLLVLLLIAVFLFGMNMQQVLQGSQGQQTVQRVVEQKVYIENSALTKAVDKILPSIVLVFVGSELDAQNFLLKGDFDQASKGLLLTQDGLIATVPFDKPAELIWVFVADGKYYAAEKVFENELLYLKANLPGDVVEVPELATNHNLVSGQKILAISGFVFSRQSRVQDLLLNNIKAGLIDLVKADEINKIVLQMTPALGDVWKGAPLVNLDGQVIGMNLGKGVISADEITQQLKLLREKSQIPTQKWGFGFVMLNEKLSKLMAFNAPSKAFTQIAGAYIWPIEGNAIEAGSFAAVIGLKTGDLILEFDGKSVKTLVDMQERLMRKRAGEKVKLKVARLLPTLSKAIEPEILDLEAVIK